MTDINLNSMKIRLLILKRSSSRKIKEGIKLYKKEKLIIETIERNFMKKNYC